MPLRRPEDRCAAIGTEAKRLLLAVVRHANVLRVPSGDADSIPRPSRLHPEHAAGPTLALEAVTHRDHNGIVPRRHLELAAAANALASQHAPILRDRSGDIPEHWRMREAATAWESDIGQLGAVSAEGKLHASVRVCRRPKSLPRGQHRA
jgi:hypothetical protein